MKLPRLVLTRPRAQAASWLHRLTVDGLEAVNLPLLDLVQEATPQARASLEARWAALGQCALVVFVSPGAVDAFFVGGPRAWPTSTLAAAPGPGTAERLRECGVPPQCIVQPAADSAQFDSESLWGALASRADRAVRREAWVGERVLLVRGDGGREWLADRLREAGAEVEIFQAYRRTPPVWTLAERATFADALAAPEANRWVFSSSEGLSHLPTLAGLDWPCLQAGLQGWATHPRILQAALALGLQRTELVSPEASEWLARLQRGQGGALPTIGSRNASPS